MIDCWNDTDCLAKLSKAVPYALTVLGVLVAIGGIVKNHIDSRLVELNQRTETQRKNTPPLIDVQLGNSSSTKETLLEIKTQNEIPFKARWSVLTTRNELVSGIMLKDFEVHPTKEKRRFLVKLPINADKVRGNYIELHFTFTSLYFAEMNDPPHLEGTIIKKYRYLNGLITPWGIKKQRMDT